jgi:hypothetical protein
MLEKVHLEGFREGQVYKATGRGFYKAESVTATKQFFARTDLIHVVMLTSNSEHGYIFKAFTQLMAHVEQRNALQELRFTSWRKYYWSITSLSPRDLLHLEQIVLDYAHTLSRSCYALQGQDGVIEVFPFQGKNFRALKPQPVPAA